MVVRIAGVRWLISAGAAGRVVGALLVAGFFSGCRASGTPTDPSNLNCAQVVLSPATQSISAEGGSLRIAVAAPASCHWAAQSHVDWLQVTNGAQGTGNGSIALLARQTFGLSPRSGAIFVSESSVVITQAGTVPPASCVYSLRPSVRNVPAASSQFLIVIATQSGCPYMRETDAISHVPWLTLSPDKNGPIEATVAVNSSAQSRTGTATIVGQTLTVVQDGTSNSLCEYRMVPSSATFGALGGTGTVAVDTGVGCAWSVGISGPGEVSVLVDHRQETGPGSRSYTVPPNRTLSNVGSSLPLLADLGRQVGLHTIAQSAASCVYRVDPVGATVPASGGSGSFSVTAMPESCEWTAGTVAPWIASVTPASAAGAATVNYRVSSNEGAGRSSDIVIRGVSGLNPSATFTVSQP